ncbi:MAG: AAA family ATPase, partial [Terriglobales bacterium]
MQIKIPELCLIALVGTTGSGKSTFARKHFRSTEVVSSDYCRGVVSDDETDQASTNDAFELLHFIARKRLSRGKLTVVDATNVQPEARKQLVSLAHSQDCFAYAIVLDVSPEVCEERNATRPDRDFGAHVLRNQHAALRRSLRSLEREGFRGVAVLRGQDQIDNAEIVREQLWVNRKTEAGPFDIIGDIHGCFDELLQLVQQLGYEVEGQNGGEGTDETPIIARHPSGRKLVFVGDLVDRGPRTPDVLRLVMGSVAQGQAYCVVGNHDSKLMRALRGKNVKISHGLAESLEQIAPHSEQFKADVVRFLDGLISHYIFDGGKLVVAHAGLKQPYQGRTSKRVREFAMYGETTGETDEYGLPVRYNWAGEY